MQVKQTVVLFLLLLSLHRVCDGQSLPSEFPVHQGVYSISNSRNADFFAQSGNAMIRQLALQLMKAPERTHFEIAYSYKLLFANLKDKTLTFSFRLDVDSVSGDVKAGIFDISDVLKPLIVSFGFELIGADGQVLDTISVSKLEPGHDVIFNRILKEGQEFYPLLADVRLKNVRFGYEEKQQISVINRLNEIRAYEAACMLCDSLQLDASRLNRQTVSPSPELALEIFRLTGAVRILGQLYSKWAKVPGSYDPAHLQQKQMMLAYRVILIQRLFLKQASGGKVPMPLKNMQGLARWWVNGQVTLLNEKRFPGYAAAVFTKLGKLSFSPPDMLFLNQSLTLVIKGVGSEISPHAYAWAFSDAATKVYLKQGARLIEEGHYNEASRLLSNAAGMCAAIPFSTVSDHLFRQQARAYYGTYFAYIGVATKALDSNLPDIASGYVEAADAFQKENSRFIILNTEVKNLCKRLFDIWLSRGNQKLESGKPAGALHDFEKAEWASATINSGIASEMISGKVRTARQKIAQLRLDRSLKNPGAAWSLEEPDEVFKQLSIADRLFITDGAPANQEYTNLKSKLVIQEIERMLKQSKSAAATGDCESANFLLNNTRQLLSDFQLPANKLLEEEFSKVSHAVDSCNCVRKKQQCLVLLKDARRLARFECYIPAASVCSQALRIMEESGSCIPDIRTAVALSDSLHWPSAYQELMLDADSLAFVGAADKSLKCFIQAGEIFGRYKLDKLKLKHPSLLEFAVNRHNLEIYSQVVILLLRSGNIEESLLLLRRMKDEGYSAEDCKDSQEIVAEKFALRDGPEPSLVRLNNKIFNYTGDSGWFIYFKKMYLKVIRL